MNEERGANFLRSASVLGVLCAIISQMLFGLSFVFTKTAVSKYHVSELLAWRFAVACLALTLLNLTGCIHIRVSRKTLWGLIGISLLYPGLYFIAETYGVAMISVSEAGLIVANVPIITAIMAWLFLKEIPCKQMVVGILLVMPGMVLCTVAKGLTTSLSWLGYGLVLISITSYCLYTVLNRRLKDCSPLSVTYVQLVIGLVLFGSWAIVHNMYQHTLPQFAMLPFQHMDFLTAVLYLALACSCVALFLCNKGLEYIGANRFSAFIALEPLVTIISGMLMLGESLTILQGIGAALTIFGVYLVSTAKK